MSALSRRLLVRRAALLRNRVPELTALGSASASSIRARREVSSLSRAGAWLSSVTASASSPHSHTSRVSTREPPEVPRRSFATRRRRRHQVKSIDSGGVVVRRPADVREGLEVRRHGGSLDDAQEVVGERTDKLVYEAPYINLVTKVKAFSALSAVVTSTAAPIMVFLNDSSSGLSPITQAAMGFSVFVFGLSSTAMLTWFLNPYVIRLYISADRNEYIAERLNVLARTKVSTFSVNSLQKADVLRPLVSFVAEGQYYYVVSESVRNGPLLRRAPWIQR